MESLSYVRMQQWTCCFVLVTLFLDEISSIDVHVTPHEIDQVLSLEDRLLRADSGPLAIEAAYDLATLTSCNKGEKKVFYLNFKNSRLILRFEKSMGKSIECLFSVCQSLEEILLSLEPP